MLSCYIYYNNNVYSQPYLSQPTIVFIRAGEWQSHSPALYVSPILFTHMCLLGEDTCAVLSWGLKLHVLLHTIQCKIFAFKIIFLLNKNFWQQLLCLNKTKINSKNESNKLLAHFNTDCYPHSSSYAQRSHTPFPAHSLECMQ